MNPLKIYITIFSICTFNTIAGHVNTNISDSRIIAEIPFVLTEHNNISDTSTINKSDTVNLMFHTASSSITLIEATSEKSNSIIWNNEHAVESWGGKSSSRFSEVNFLQVGELEWDSISIWENKNSGPQTDGKFGPDLFNGHIIEIDFDNNLITLYSSLPAKAEQFDKLNLISEGEFMFIEAISLIEENKYRNKYLIHSGYGGTVLYDDKFVKSNKLGEKLEVVNESQLKDSYGNILKTKKAILPSFKIGNTEFKDLPVGFFEGTINRQKMSILGGDLLKRFNIIIDAERKHIYIKQNQFLNSAYSNISN